MVFKTEEAAVAAVEDDELGSLLSTDEFCDERQGFATAEIVTAELAMMRKVPVIDLKAKSMDAWNTRQFGLGSAEDCGHMVAKMLAQQETAAALIKQVVLPAVSRMEQVGVQQGKRVVAAVKSDMKEEIGPLTELVKHQQKSIDELTKMVKVLGGGQIRKEADERADEDDEPPKKLKRAVLAKTTERPDSARKPVGKRKAPSRKEPLSQQEIDTLLARLEATEGGTQLMTGLMGPEFMEKLKPEGQGEYDDSDMNEGMDGAEEHTETL